MMDANAIAAMVTIGVLLLWLSPAMIVTAIIESREAQRAATTKIGAVADESRVPEGNAPK